MAVENARLYRSLADKAHAIRAVEGIQREHRRVDQRGVLAAGLDDRVESWNSQMERLTGIRAGEALVRSFRFIPRSSCPVHFEACRAATTFHQL